MLERRLLVLAGAAILALALGAISVRFYEMYRLRNDLLAGTADRVAGDPALASAARDIATKAYQQNCAGCHGDDRRGAPDRSVPALTGPGWIHGTGRATEIERTILYGVRSGHGKSRNVAQMPGFGLTRRLSPDEISDLTAFVLSLGKAEVDEAKARRGRVLFEGKGLCFDCHAADAAGNPDYGAPSLRAAQGLYRRDWKTVYRVIYDGSQGMCPAWIGRLDFVTIRALAVLLSTPAPAGTAHAP